LFSGEIDTVDELISIGLLEGKILRRGPYFYIGDSEEGFKGRDDLESNLKNNPELFKEAKKLVFNVK